MSTEERCENCYFWRNQECHRYPPRPRDAGRIGDAGVETFWPATVATDWCGSHESIGEVFQLKSPTTLEELKLYVSAAVESSRSDLRQGVDFVRALLPIGTVVRTVNLWAGTIVGYGAQPDLLAVSPDTEAEAVLTGFPVSHGFTELRLDQVASILERIDG